MIYQSERIKKSNKPVFIFFTGFLVISIVGISVWFLRLQTVTSPHATAATTLTFSPSSQTVTNGSSFVTDIIVDPGNNQVSAIKLNLTYDNSHVEIASPASSLLVNQQAFPQTLSVPVTSCNGTQCTLSAIFSVGSDPTKVIQTKTTVATLTLKALTGASNSTTNISFNASTSVYSVYSADQMQENVLASASPLTLVITGNNSVCMPNQSNCSWDAVTNATGYHYKVTETVSGGTIKEGNVDASQTSVTFASEAGKTYKCEVNASNICGKGSSGVGKNTCPVPTATPTPSPSVTPMPTICAGPGTVQNLHIVCPNCQ